MLTDIIAIISLGLAAINTCMVIVVWLATRNRYEQRNAEVIKAHLALIDIALARIEERLKSIESHQHIIPVSQ